MARQRYISAVHKQLDALLPGLYKDNCQHSAQKEKAVTNELEDVHSSGIFPDDMLNSHSPQTQFPLDSTFFGKFIRKEFQVTL